ncbi:glycosyltransferase involved in cell wall biosynthesis [Rhodovulum bhavnagarense]|uniref:Glycosyltransferase involved in cell wall biosynthesis n=1 Tax=Rhodovulum bhavnagarense TaxID=992286 RepID=A0A4R2R6T4_9RHOB|nr:glycosyltransferase [Rhodovulum bhavnagarense]TCP58772.1 glycosyltransferase involved in cell wall biosynthesis [Rhodovulum bhavnagarense]
MQGVRIVHAATSANMLTAFGRVMADRLNEEGAELYFVASSRPIYGRPADKTELAAMGGTPLTLPLENNIRPWNIVANTYRFWRILRRLRPSVVHTRASVMGIVGRLAAWLAGVPCVVHHQDDLYAREEQLSPRRRRQAAALERWFANRSDCTFVVSDAVSEAAQRLGFDATKVVNVGHDLSKSIRSGAVISRPARDDVALFAKLGIREDNFLVGSVTRLEAHKGVDTLVRAAAQVVEDAPQVRFLVRGRGPAKAQLEEMIAECGLTERFFLVEDWLSDRELVELYKSFDLFALPTRREGFGMAFAEAMFLGVVPIAPDIPPVNEVVRPKTGLLVPPTDTAFAEAILWSAKHPEEIASLRQTAIADAEARWGGTRAADAVIATYTRLLKGS